MTVRAYTDVGDVPVDGHDSNRCAFGADDRDPAACGIADDPAMGEIDAGSIRADNFSVAPFERKGVHCALSGTDDRCRTVVTGDVDARSIVAYKNAFRVRADAIRADDVVQTADDLDRIHRYDVDLAPIGLIATSPAWPPSEIVATTASPFCVGPSV